ncbi:MAG: DEAD/DEAH box helicase [Enterococcus sp.]|nr:DEAD/DEAH box helicase [Enterococcus sp.]
MPGAVYDSKLKKHTYVGETLPESLAPYQSKDFSWLRWQEDNYNKTILPFTSVSYKMTPRSHQKEAAVAIAKAAKTGWRGFIEGDGTGLGKTISSAFGIYGAMKMKKQRKVNVLVICPKSVIEHWGNTFKALGIAGNMRICVINYEQSKNLLKAPASAKNAKLAKTKNRQTLTKGTPVVKWDYIIADESQRLKNWESAQVAKAFGNIARYQEATDWPFVIWSSATIGQTPLELRYLAPILYQATKTSNRTTWKTWLENNGFHIKIARKSGNISWIAPKADAPDAEVAEIKAARKSDLLKLNKLLFSAASPSIRRKPQDIAGWPEIQRIAKGYSLEPMEYVQYQKEWLMFRTQYRLALRGKNPNGALAQQLRFRQKSSLIRTSSTIEEVTDLLDNNFQVAVFCEFMESIDKMREALEKKNIPTAEYTGRNENFRESERVRFQKGRAKVIFFSTDSGISLHAEEILPDGSKATSTKRTTLLHDVTYSGIKCSQIEGRTHRDGQFAPVYYLYALKTTEAKIAETMIGRVQNILSIMDDEALAHELDSLLVSDG